MVKKGKETVNQQKRDPPFFIGHICFTSIDKNPKKTEKNALLKNNFNRRKKNRKKQFDPQIHLRISTKRKLLLHNKLLQNKRKRKPTNKHLGSKHILVKRSKKVGIFPNKRIYNLLFSAKTRRMYFLVGGS